MTEKKSQERKEKENSSFIFLKLPPTGFAGSTGIYCIYIYTYDREREREG